MPVSVTALGRLAATRRDPTCDRPAAVRLQDGDEIAIEVADPHHFRVTRDPRCDEALATLRALGWTLPSDFHFSREEANARGK